MTEGFRELSQITEPDSGWTVHGVFDPQSGEFRSITLDDIYRPLSVLNLNKSVPVEVQAHFDTTRNLALYAWYVRRFIPVADWHACASLELALKIKTDGKIRGLFNLIRHAIAQGWVKNEGFSQWQAIRERSEGQLELHRRLFEHLGRPFHPPNGGAFQWDYVSLLLDSIPYMRNEYAHGSPMFYPGTMNLREVAEFINQLFPDDNDSEEGNHGLAS